MSTGSQAVAGLTEQDCRLDDFRAVGEQRTELRDYPTAKAMENKVVIYDAKQRCVFQPRLRSRSR